MNPIEVKVYQNKETLYDELSEYYINEIKQHPNLVLGLATGSTPIPLYERLVKDHKENDTDYRNVTTYNLDEYLGLPKSHPESYDSFMHRHLFHGLNIPKENIHLPNAESINPAMDYQELLNQVQIDIQLLGVGSNGHIGFNEPNTPFQSIVHTVELAEQTRKDNARFFQDISEVPTHAITMGIQNILQAKKIILVATGENKSDAIYQLIHGEKKELYPITALQEHPNVIVYLDQAAAEKLPKES